MSTRPCAALVYARHLEPFTNLSAEFERVARYRQVKTALAGTLLLLLQIPLVGQNPAPAVPPQQAPLPPARELVARHVAAIGGEAAQKAVKSMRVRGTVAIVAQGLSGDFEALSARPARMLQRITIPAIGKIESGYDGKVAWRVDPQSGPALLTGRELTELQDDAWFDSALHGPEHVREVTTVERMEFDKRPAYKLKVTYVSGNQEFQYFDSETGLQIGTEGSRAMPLGVLPVVSILRDYKRFGKLMQPTTVVQRTMGLEQAIHVASCEYDVVPANAFDLPPQVKALIR